MIGKAEMNLQIENTILRNLLTNEDYMRKVLPFIKPDYFDGPYKALFKEAGKFVAKYNKLPTQEAFLVELNEHSNLSGDTFTAAVEIAKQLFTGDKVDDTWLLDNTEKWCQDRAIYNAVMESISIIDGKHDTLTKNALPDLLTKALGVAFDTSVGHDYVDNAEQRFDFYHTEEDRIPFDLDYLNKITKGGVPRKTLNIALAGTGVGKSLFMCHVAASALVEGRNVLYITMEMSEEKIAERIDANLLNVNIKDIGQIPEQIFTQRVKEIGRKTQGRLIIKEYPTASAHSGHFKALLSELSLKKYFKPDIIFVDYLNICASSRYKGHIVNSYTYVKAIAEELRGLAVENDLPVVSATQTTRSGFGNTDVDITDTSESFGLPATADFMFALVSTEELEQSGRIMVKQLKNRYNDLTYYRRFTVGIDRPKMKLYNVEDSDADNILDTEDEDTFETFEEESSKQNRLNKFSQFVI